MKFEDQHAYNLYLGVEFVVPMRNPSCCLALPTNLSATGDIEIGVGDSRPLSCLVIVHRLIGFQRISYGTTRLTCLRFQQSEAFQFLRPDDDGPVYSEYLLKFIC